MHILDGELENIKQFGIDIRFALNDKIEEKYFLAKRLNVKDISIILNKPKINSIKYLYKNIEDTISYYNKVFSNKYLYDKNRKIEYYLDGEKKTLSHVTRIPSDFADFFRAYLVFFRKVHNTEFYSLLCENFRKIMELSQSLSSGKQGTIYHGLSNYGYSCEIDNCGKSINLKIIDDDGKFYCDNFILNRKQFIKRVRGNIKKMILVIDQLSKYFERSYWINNESSADF
jgi:hypothetical protein